MTERSEQRRKLEEKGERQTRLENEESFGAREPDAKGRAGGDLARDVASRHEAKRAFEQPAGRSAPRKQDQGKA